MPPDDEDGDDKAPAGGIVSAIPQQRPAPSQVAFAAQQPLPGMQFNVFQPSAPQPPTGLPPEQASALIEFAKSVENNDLDRAIKSMEADKVERRDKLWFSVFAMLLVAALLVTMTLLGHGEVISDLLKYLATFGVGGIGGYSYAKRSQ